MLNYLTQDNDAKY